MNRQEIIDLICKKAHEHGLEPWELLGGAIAESGLDPSAERDGVPPDVSFGLFQQTARYAPEGNLEHDLARMRELYFDPAHATDVAAENYKRWRYNPDVPAEQAWCAYNWPGSYRHYQDNPNLENYRRGLAEARRILGVDAVPDPVYDPTTEQQQQDDPWSCSCVSTWWGMTAFGRHPAEPWVENTMLADGIVSQDRGLLDGSGGQLAQWITTQWGEFGYRGVNSGLVSYDDVKSLAGQVPVLIGGHRWGAGGHWTGVRRYDASNDWLELANPANGYDGIMQTLNRQQFDARAPFSMVAIRWGGTEAPPVAPDPSPAPDPDLAALQQQLAELQARVVALQAEKDGLVVALADIDDRVGDLLDGYAEALKGVVGQMRANREQFLGPRP